MKEGTVPLPPLRKNNQRRTSDWALGSTSNSGSTDMEHCLAADPKCFMTWVVMSMSGCVVPHLEFANDKFKKGIKPHLE